MSTRAGRLWSASLAPLPVKDRGVGIARNRRNNPVQSRLPMHLSPAIFITAAAKIARETVSAANRFEHETGNPRKFKRKASHVAFVFVSARTPAPSGRNLAGLLAWSI
jgi:hypothetical protein